MLLLDTSHNRCEAFTPVKDRGILGRFARPEILLCFGRGGLGTPAPWSEPEKRGRERFRLRIAACPVRQDAKRKPNRWVYPRIHPMTKD